MLLLAILALGLLVYTYVGYPIVIAMCARLWPSSIRRDPGFTPQVSALIPVFNAERYIRAKVESLLALDYPAERLEFLFYDDASSDGSLAILKELAAAHPDRIRVFSGSERAGKPTALNTLRPEARGEVLFMTDIRQPMVPRCLRELVSVLADPSVGAVSGNLELQGGTGAGAYWKYEKWIRQNEGRFRSLVGVSGAVYALRKSDLVDLPVNIALDDMWVPMRLRLQGKRVVFAPKAIAYDEAFEDGREFGRKARTLAGNYQLLAALPTLLVPIVNPSWFETFSHKIARLLCPWALIALLVVPSVALVQSAEAMSAWQRVLMQTLLAGQGAFYLLAVVGKRAGKIGGLARTFVVLNVAALVGLWRFVLSRQKVTW